MFYKTSKSVLTERLANSRPIELIREFDLLTIQIADFSAQANLLSVIQDIKTFAPLSNKWKHIAGGGRKSLQTFEQLKFQYTWTLAANAIQVAICHSTAVKAMKLNENPEMYFKDEYCLNLLVSSVDTLMQINAYTFFAHLSNAEKLYTHANVPFAIKTIVNYYKAVQAISKVIRVPH